VNVLIQFSFRFHSSAKFSKNIGTMDNISSNSSDGVKDTILKAKDIKIVLEDPQGRRLVLENSNTGHLITVG